MEKTLAPLNRHKNSSLTFALLSPSAERLTRKANFTTTSRWRRGRRWRRRVRSTHSDQKQFDRQPSLDTRDSGTAVRDKMMNSTGLWCLNDSPDSSCSILIRKKEVKRIVESPRQKRRTSCVCCVLAESSSCLILKRDRLITQIRCSLQPVRQEIRKQFFLSSCPAALDFLFLPVYVASRETRRTNQWSWIHKSWDSSCLISDV